MFKGGLACSVQCISPFNRSRCNIFFVAVCMTEVPPLFVVEFLHRVVETFEDYFSECSESSIKVPYRALTVTVGR
jgi:hypothetical protein